MIRLESHISQTIFFRSTSLTTSDGSIRNFRRCLPAAEPSRPRWRRSLVVQVADQERCSYPRLYRLYFGLAHSYQLLAAMHHCRSDSVWKRRHCARSRSAYLFQLCRIPQTGHCFLRGKTPLAESHHLHDVNNQNKHNSAEPWLIFINNLSPPMVVIALCHDVAPILGSLCIFGVAALYFMLTIGKK